MTGSMRRWLGWLAVLTVVACLYFGGWLRVYTRSEAFLTGMELLRTEPSVAELLGQDLRLAGLPSGSVAGRGAISALAEATLMLPLAGSRAEGRVVLRLVHDGARWRPYGGWVAAPAGSTRLPTADRDRIEEALLHLGRARALSRNARHAEALRAIEIAQSIDPGNATLYRWEGMVLENAGEMETPIVAYERALALAPGYADGHHSLARMYGRAGDYARAIEAADRALSIRPRDPYAWQVRGVARYASGDYEGAVKDVGRACRLGSAQACQLKERYGG